MNNYNKDLNVTSNKPVPIDVKTKDFYTLMNIYEMALVQVKDEIESMKTSLNDIYQYNVINNIDCRIKTPDSIIKKMQKKNYDLNYKNLIENIDDIAGIRIICPFKHDIIKIKETIENNNNLEILEEKDYVSDPKGSGYSGFHIIAQTPVNVGETFANVKTEIQIRTMAMDFWSTTEHKIKYKAKNNLSKSDSKKMVRYAKIINNLDEKISKINDKYRK